jgi:hypothetical protein
MKGKTKKRYMLLKHVFIKLKNDSNIGTNYE